MGIHLPSGVGLRRLTARAAAVLLVAVAGCGSSGINPPGDQTGAKTVVVTSFPLLERLKCDEADFSATVSQGKKILPPAKFHVGRSDTSGTPIPLDDLDVRPMVTITMQVTSSKPLRPLQQPACRPFVKPAAWQFKALLRRVGSHTYEARFDPAKDKEKPPEQNEPDQGMRG